MPEHHPTPFPLRRYPLVLLILLYLALGTLFAWLTPAWQAPDEPAHYNYIRHLATQARFPVLQMGDYPHSYLEEIKARRFPPDLSIEPIRYEFHQPPLYYMLLTPFYTLAAGSLLALRLVSVLLGAGTIVVAWGIGRRLFPQRPAVGLGAAAFVAFLPQHLASVSQVGNDALAELLFALVLWMLVEQVSREPEEVPAARTNARGGLSGEGVRLGVLLGLILITKTTAYIALPLAVGVWIWRWWRQRAGLRQVIGEAVAIAVPALLIALPWYARNVAVYGWPDFLGLIRHDAVVVGQMRTATYLAQYGWGDYGRRLVEFTFKSFWGVFGWLGAFMDSRVYFALMLVSLVAAGGLLLRLLNRAATAAPMARAACLLGWVSALTLFSYAWYNVQFVQHQGRYLFMALIPVALAFALGWEGALLPRCSRWLAAGLLLLAVGLVAWGLLTGRGLPKWPLALTLAASAALAARPLLPRRLDPLLVAAPYAWLPLVSLYALFGVIVPQLR